MMVTRTTNISAHVVLRDLKSMVKKLYGDKIGNLTETEVLELLNEMVETQTRIIKIEQT